MALLLRDSMHSGILTNIEVWYGLTSSQIEELEEVDLLLMQRILEVPGSTPTEALYLELGCYPLKFTIIYIFQR